MIIQHSHRYRPFRGQARRNTAVVETSSENQVLLLPIESSDLRPYAVRPEGVDMIVVGGQSRGMTDVAMPSAFSGRLNERRNHIASQLNPNAEAGPKNSFSTTNGHE